MSFSRYQCGHTNRQTYSSPCYVALQSRRQRNRMESEQNCWRRWYTVKISVYPRIFVSSFPYTFVSVNRRNNEARTPTLQCWIIPSIYGYKRIRGTGFVKIRKTRHGYFFYSVAMTRCRWLMAVIESACQDSARSALSYDDVNHWLSLDQRPPRTCRLHLHTSDDDTSSNCYYCY